MAGELTSEPNTDLLPDLAFDTLMPNAPFHELHRRVVEAPIEEVWPALLGVTGNEIRLLKPLFALRGLPTMLRGARGPMPTGEGPALDLFAEEGFVMLRQDPEPIDGRALLIFGAAGKFWLPAHNTPRRFESPEEFIGFDEPGFAKTVARFEAIAEGPSRTRLETETLVVGTDTASRRKFAPYWAIIRGPSGLLRRSWLAAVDRRLD